MSEPQLLAALANIPGLPPKRPRPMTGVTWHAVDLATGRRGPRVQTRALGTVSRILSSPAETTIDAVIQDKGKQVPGWDPATQPGMVMLVAVDQNDQPIWGGMCYRRLHPSVMATYVTLNLITLEGYLDRRYVDADYTFTDADQVSVIAAQMVQSTLAWGINFAIDAPTSNFRRDRSYLVDDDKTILSLLDELAGQLDGIEYTVDLAWADDDHEVLTRTIRIRNRIGTAYLGQTGVQSASPAAVFQFPGSIVDAQYVEDYSAEHGANGVIAVSSGEGESRPESKLHIALDVVVGWGGQMAMFEERYTPAESISDNNTLDDHAHLELLQTWNGLNELTITAQMDEAPQFGVDWFLGDEVGLVITNPRFPERTNIDGGRLPGVVAIQRCTGLDIDFDARQIKPTLIGLQEVQVVTS